MSIRPGDRFYYLSLRIVGWGFIFGAGVFALSIVFDWRSWIAATGDFGLKAITLATVCFGILGVLLANGLVERAIRYLTEDPAEPRS